MSLPLKLGVDQCLSVIGMAGAGKSTIGLAVAEALDFAHVDSDYLIEASYGVRLQGVADALSKDEFLDVESQTIQGIRMQRAVISTGGSVIYRPEAMEHLAFLGPILFLDVELPVILERIARKPDRGLAIAPGQTIEDLFAEREALYKHWATHTLKVGNMSILQCVESILHSMA